MSFDLERVHVLRSRDDEERRVWFRAALKALLKVKTKEVIAIKPNLGSALRAETGATTELWMIEETIAWIRKRRGRPIVVEGPSHIHDFDQVMRVTGAKALFDRLGVEYMDARHNTIQLRPLKHEDASGRVYNVSMGALSADGIVCLPKLKTHNRTGVTLGMKGLMGLLGLPDRHGFHNRGVDADVVELFNRLRGRIRATFVDGITAMEGHGPTGGRPVDMGVIVGGRDLVAVDAVGAMIMGFDAVEVHHIRSAAERGLGDRRRAWQMHPESIPLPVRMFERPRPDNGVRTRVMTFPPISSLLRAGKMGVRGRTKPVLKPGVSAVDAARAASVCPEGAIGHGGIDYTLCVGCALCLEAHPELFVREGKRHKFGRVVKELLS